MKNKIQILVYVLFFHMENKYPSFNYQCIKYWTRISCYQGRVKLQALPHVNSLHFTQDMETGVYLVIDLLSFPVD